MEISYPIKLIEIKEIGNDFLKGSTFLIKIDGLKVMFGLIEGNIWDTIDNEF